MMKIYMIDKAVKEAYVAQISTCKNKVDVLGNPVEMRMSLQQFADKWIQSGHWDERGRGRDKYCMARNNDIGHYEWDNVRIITNAENVREAKKGKTQSAETCAKRSATLTGKPKTIKHAANISSGKKGKPSPHKGKPGKAVFTEETFKKMRAAKKDKPWSAARRAAHEKRKAQA